MQQYGISVVEAEGVLAQPFRNIRAVHNVIAVCISVIPLLEQGEVFRADDGIQFCIDGGGS